MSDNSHSMDELLLKTVGLIETLPDRIGKLEGIVRELEKDFAAHQAKGESVLDKVSKVDGFSTKLEELKTEIDEMKKQVEPIIKDHYDKEETKKTLMEYVKEVISSFIRYAMLPFTIILLLLLGLDPSYIPWYKPAPQSVHKSVSFNQVLIEIVQRSKDNEIKESEIRFFLHSNLSFVHQSKAKTMSEAISELSRIDKELIFIWLPYGSTEGFVSLLGKDGKSISNQIRINRGI